ncbi:hypothetical protein PLESTB_000182700 [Pleodorina starrii]|uniref:ABM domain-containing protein n=1 Tax=Pleodorina starrii TaxID=330485 RepID=A0A9W6BCG2_9CHLO|nr:hypothetical protein PLESTM_000514000 [Pleodorina starrii]GLC49102.1 hypothetical protein PLESTB_000182700 [Pleodorina starrii]
MLPVGQVTLRPFGSPRSHLPVGGRAIQRQPRTSTQAGHGPTPSGGQDDPLKGLDLKSLNDLPLAKLSETANAVWERIRASGVNVKVVPSSQLLPPNLMPPGVRPPLGGGGSSAPSNGATPHRLAGSEDSAELATTERAAAGGVSGGGGGGGGREQRLMAALAQAQDERRQLADRSELLVAQLSMLESKNAKLVRELEAAEAGRGNALRLRDVLLEERDTLAGQLREAQEEVKRISEGVEARDGALEALRLSQEQLQEELREAVTRLQAVDRSTEELRSQLASLESSRAAATTERDDLATHLRDLVGRVEQLGDLLSLGQEQQQQQQQHQQQHQQQDMQEREREREQAGEGGPPVGVEVGAAGADSSPVAAAASQLAQLRSTTEGAFAALRVARDELGLLRAENQQLVQRAEALAGSNRELAATTEALKQQVAEARTELDEQRRQAAELRGREAALQAELAASVSERETAAAAAATAAAQRDELTAAVAELSAVRDAAAAAGLGLVELGKMATQINTLKEQLAASRASETDLKRRLAAAEVAVLDGRRAAAAAEARLASERDSARRDATALRAALHARSLASQVARRSGLPLAPSAEGQFVACNRFWVPAELMYDFVKAVAAREVALVEARGFLGIAVRSEQQFVMAVSTQWESLAVYEEWARSDEARRHHYPGGVYQFAPRRGEGFPEDYLPFREAPEAAATPAAAAAAETATQR